MYSIVIQYFYILYFIKSYYKLMAIMPCVIYIYIYIHTHTHTYTCCLSILHILAFISYAHTLNFLHLISFSSLGTASLFSISVSLFLSCIYTHLYCFLDSMYKWYHTVFACVWLISLSIIFSRSIQTAANGRLSFFLWLSNIHIYIYIFHILFMDLSKGNQYKKKML